MKNNVVILFLTLLLSVCWTGYCQQLDLLGNPIEIHSFDLERIGQLQGRGNIGITYALTGQPQLVLRNVKTFLPTPLFARGRHLYIYRGIEIAKIFDNSEALYEWSKKANLRDGGFKTTVIVVSRGHMIILSHRYLSLARLELLPEQKNPLSDLGEVVSDVPQGLADFTVYLCKFGEGQQAYLFYYEADHSIYAAESLAILESAFLPSESGPYLTQPELDTLTADTDMRDSLYWSVSLPDAYYESVLQESYQSQIVNDAALERIDQLKSYEALERIVSVRQTTEGGFEVRYLENYEDEEKAEGGLSSNLMSRDRSTSYGKGAGLKTAHSKGTEWKREGNQVMGYLLIDEAFDQRVKELTEKQDKLPPPAEFSPPKKK